MQVAQKLGKDNADLVDVKLSRKIKSLGKE
jgi:hypothetical protein